MGLDNPLHVLLILLVVALLFGARRLPDLGRSLGDAMRGFRESLHGEGRQASAIALPATALAALPAAPPEASTRLR